MDSDTNEKRLPIPTRPLAELVHLGYSWIPPRLPDPRMRAEYVEPAKINYRMTDLCKKCERRQKSTENKKNTNTFICKWCSHNNV